MYVVTIFTCVLELVKLEKLTQDAKNRTKLCGRRLAANLHINGYEIFKILGNVKRYT